ncbi:MAG TPA: VanW family protein [Rhizomicrobium sp.]
MNGIAIKAARPSLAHPTRLSSLLFEAKAAVFKVERLARDMADGTPLLSRIRLPFLGNDASSSRTPLWSDTRLAERVLQWGKVHNLRVAARTLDGTVIPAGAVFSFWKQLGRPSRSRGFVDGRMLKEGCLVPSVGGGLCQLSNALYDVALQAGCGIVERHGHSRIVPGSQAASGRDATVAWNYVDLRFRAPRDLVLRVAVERDTLDVMLLAAEPNGIQTRRLGTPPVQGEHAESCGTCDRTTCFRHETVSEMPIGKTAFLVDANWPEFRAYVARAKKAGDVLGLPLNGARWGFHRYAWDTTDYARVVTSSMVALTRAVALRLAKQGSLRRPIELWAAKMQASRMARALTPEVTEVCVAQSLLPCLWRDGHLGGRKFTVLMTRLPMADIQARLDAAALVHPERRTLSDFRADPALVAAEAAALAAADAIITPHAEIAELFGTRALRLEWLMPKALPRTAAGVPRRIAFPGPTLARKGAYELREAARALDLEVVPTGNDLEGAGFWDGIRIRRAKGLDWLDGIAAVVQPALLEEAPRPLLAALASGIPVIATKACGLGERAGVTIVPPGDVSALSEALRLIRN